jgi:PAS domain S-box-containing protein
MSRKGYNTLSPDITKRKQVKEALQESITPLKVIFDAIQIGILVINADTHEIVDANPSAIESIGTTKDKIVGNICHKFICPAEKGKCPITDLGLTVDKSERVLLNASGQKIPIIKTVKTMIASGQKLLVESFMDITARKQMEEEHKTIIQTAIDGFWLVDMQGRLLDVNDAYCKLVGYSREELLKMSIPDIEAIEKPEETAARIAKIMKVGRDRFETCHRCKDGRIVDVEISVNYIEVGGGRMFVFVRDITERKRTDEKLQESESRYRDLFENAHDMIQSVAPDGRFIFVNRAWLETLGYTEAELPNLNLFQIIHPESLSHCQEIFAKVMAGESVRNVEATFVAKDGRTIQVEGNASARRIDGKVVSTHGIFRDITGRKQAGEALRFSDAALKSIHEGVIAMDTEFTITYWNEMCEQMFGVKASEAIGKYVGDVIQMVEDHPGQNQERVNLLTTRGWNREEQLYRTPRGDVWVDVHAQAIEANGKRYGWVTLAADITGRKKAEEALTNEATRRRILIEQSRDGIVVLDQEGNVYEANQRFTEMLGYSREETLQLSVWDWEFQFPPEQVLDMIRTVDETGDHFETQHRRKDGTTYNVEISTNAAVFGGQKLIFCVCRDITERKRAEQELQEKNKQLDVQNEELRATQEELRSAKEKLEDRVKERTAELEVANEELRATQEQLVRSEKLAALGQLAGGVGHELRNPLGAIKNAVYYVRGKVANNELGQKEPRVMEFLNIIDDEINSSNKIINDLLNFSRAGKPAVSPARIGMVIDDAIAHTPIPENIGLTKKLDTGLPEVEIDTDQIRQVLVNIVMNAVQAMPEGGKLTIAASQRDRFLQVKVTDTGHGIPEEIIGKIFDPLFTTKAKGIGLGLAVCKSIIDRHQGHIEAESEVGKGTTFTIKLPLKAE